MKKLCSETLKTLINELRTDQEMHMRNLYFYEKLLFYDSAY